MRNRMINAFLDSVEVPVSDDEDFEVVQTVSITSVSSISVKTLIIACRPLTAVIGQLCPTRPLYSKCGEQKLGQFGHLDDFGVICLDADVCIDPFQLFECKEVIVLTHQMFNVDNNRVISESEGISSGRYDPIYGFAAHVVTLSIMKECKYTVLIAQHSSIHPSLEDALNLTEHLALLGLDISQTSELARAFKQTVPINRSVPLYS